jgi:light-harvesting complex 1 beta chain
MAQGSGMSGLSEDEARGFHGMFMMSFVLFTVVAAAAHFAAWQWRPWIPGANGYTASTTTSAPAVVATK